MQPFCYRNPDVQLCEARSGHWHQMKRLTKRLK
jgi:hypothetical protein